MISYLRKLFIPHISNNHRPHILRNESTRMIIVSILFVEAFVFLLPKIFIMQNIDLLNTASVLPSVLSDLTNKERENVGLKDLKTNELLSKAAMMKAKDMAEKSYFAHTSPEGLTPWYWIDKAGYKYQYAGENLAINFSDSNDVTEAWMKSPLHKANIVKDKYTEIGTGTAEGIYEGHSTVFVVQLYGRPSSFSGITKVLSKKDINTTLPKSEIGASVAHVEDQILGAESLHGVPTQNDTENIVTNTKVDFFHRILSTPRSTTNTILVFFFILVSIALVLNIIIKFEHHHPDLITNALACFVIIFAIYITNNFFYKDHTIVSYIESTVETVNL